MAPAVGWIVELQDRPDGLWGRAEWNRSGRSLLEDRAYQSLSPSFEHTKDNRVIKLVAVALTNNPALIGMTALASATEEEDMGLLQALAAKLGYGPPRSFNAGVTCDFGAGGSADFPGETPRLERHQSVARSSAR